MSKERIDIIGKRFGKLAVIKQINNKYKTKNDTIRNGRVFECLCDCGNKCIALAGDLINGDKKSCGCLKSGGHNKIDLTGKVFGNLTVLKETKKPKKYEGKNTLAYWECICKCGNKTIVAGSSLRSGATNGCGCGARLNPKYNLMGKKFNLLLIINRDKNTNRGNARWNCICDCGKTCIVSGSDLRSGRRKSCGCLSKRYKEDNPKFSGYKDIYKSFWTRLKNNAKIRNLEFNLKIEEIYELYIKQNKKCALSGVPIKIYSTYRTNEKDAASIDRIDSKKGYYIDNIQWILKDINKIKMDMDNSLFIDLCKKVANYS